MTALYGPQKIKHRVEVNLRLIFGNFLPIELAVRNGTHRTFALFEPPPSFWGVRVDQDIWIYTALNTESRFMTYVADCEIGGVNQWADSTNLNTVVRSVARWLLEKRLEKYIKDS